jgi:hypothetical protein
MLDVRTLLHRFKATITQQHFTQTNSSTKKERHHNPVGSANHYFFLFYILTRPSPLKVLARSVLLVRKYHFIMNDIACDIALVSNSKSLASMRSRARSDYG